MLPLLTIFLLLCAPLLRAQEAPVLTCYSTAFEPFVIEQANGEISGTYQRIYQRYTGEPVAR